MTKMGLQKHLIDPLQFASVKHEFCKPMQELPRNNSDRNINNITNNSSSSNNDNDSKRERKMVLIVIVRTKIVIITVVIVRVVE